MKWKIVFTFFGFVFLSSGNQINYVSVLLKDQLYIANSRVRDIDPETHA